MESTTETHKMGNLYLSESQQRQIDALYAKYPDLKKRGIANRIFSEGLKMAQTGQINFHSLFIPKIPISPKKLHGIKRGKPIPDPEK